MEQYFREVVSDLSMNDMHLLGTLFDNDATAGFKAMNNSEALKQSNLSTATFRKVVYRLVANKFISTVSQERQGSIYITHYGITALKTSLEGVSA